MDLLICNRKIHLELRWLWLLELIIPGNTLYIQNRKNTWVTCITLNVIYIFSLFLSTDYFLFTQNCQIQFFFKTQIHELKFIEVKTFSLFKLSICAQRILLIQWSSITISNFSLKSATALKIHASIKLN